jgi:NAD(P)-dependent dehydrogenase (short-subunit alcohol dehydrogenase family)
MNIGMLTHIKHPIREPFAAGLEASVYDMTQMLRRRVHTVALFAHTESSPKLNVRPMPLNRKLRPSRFVASVDAAYITGANLTVDGGTNA